jgi:hypothetical protein
MTHKKSFSVAALSFALLNFSAYAAQAAPTLSDFFQDWKLDTTQNNSSQCHATLSSLPLGQTPGSNDLPGVGYDSSTGITFTFNDAPTDPYDFPPATSESLSLDPSSQTGSFAHLSGNVLSVSNSKQAKTLPAQSFTLTSNGGLLVAGGTKKSSISCTYANAHPHLVGKIEVGAVLLLNGTQVAQCSFAPATPRPDQENFVYNEKCSFGKYVLKTYISDDTVVIKTVIEANSQATHDMELIRNSEKLNAGTENYLSRDTEITVVDDSVTTPVDDLSGDNDEYFISPYETQSYAVDFAQNAVVQFVYANQ